MSGQAGLHGYLGRFQIAYLADHNDIGILSEDCAQSTCKGHVNLRIDLGLTDAYRSIHPDRQAFSWWDYRAGGFHRNHGLRIDFLLASPGVAGRLRGAEIDRDYRKKKEGLTASDHAPVWIDLEP